jgi:hypothetical protein
MNRSTHTSERPDVTAISDIPGSDLPGHVIITCAECGASEIAEAGILAGAPTIVCANCGETWPAPGNPAGSAASDAAEDESAGDAGSRALSLWSASAGQWGASRDLEAVRRPFVTYEGADGPTERAWAAKIEADRDPPVVVPSRIPQFAAAIASAIFLCTLVVGRDAAVTAVPDLAGLYSAVGLPVNLDGFAIRGLEAERRGAGVAATLVVRGRIENVSQVARPVPPLVVGFRDGARTPTGARSFDPPPRDIAPGEAAPFEVTMLAVPDQVDEIVVRLRRTGEGGAPI